MILFTDEAISRAAFEVDMAILDALPEPIECKHDFSASFERQIQKLIQKAKHFTAFKVLRRVACFFIALVLSASLFVAFNPTARAVVVDWLREKVDDFYHYFFVGESEPIETVISTVPTETEVILPPEATDDGANISEATSVPTANTKDYYLSWIPEGYNLLTSYGADNRGAFIYTNNSGLIMQFNWQSGKENPTLGMGVGEYTSKCVDVGSVQADFLCAKTPEHSNAIIWKSDDGMVIFSISAFLAEDDLIKMAENLVVEEKN